MSRGGHVFLYLIYFAILVVLGHAIITAFKTTTPAPKAQPSTHHQVAQTNQTPQPAKPNPAQSQPSANNSLVNTGPGDVIGLFIITSLVGYAAHYRSRTISGIN